MTEREGEMLVGSCCLYGQEGWCLQRTRTSHSSLVCHSHAGATGDPIPFAHVSFSFKGACTIGGRVEEIVGSVEQVLRWC